MNCVPDDVKNVPDIAKVQSFFLHENIFFLFMFFFFFVNIFPFFKFLKFFIFIYFFFYKSESKE